MIRASTAGRYEIVFTGNFLEEVKARVGRGS
jgi:hypothetical protein